MSEHENRELKIIYNNYSDFNFQQNYKNSNDKFEPAQIIHTEDNLDNSHIYKEYEIPFLKLKISERTCKIIFP